jgi:hypothetical protein
MAIVVVQTWFSPIMNLYSGIVCIALLTIAYFALKPHR